MRKLDLKTHGRSRTLFGKRLQQSWPSLFVMEKILANEKPDSIIELGGGTGVLAFYFTAYAMLADHPVGFNTVDLDVKEPARRAVTLHENAYSMRANVQSDKVVDHVAAVANSADRPLVLVDAADPKCADANLYGDVLEKGTMVLVHDVVLGSDEGWKWMCAEGDVDFTMYERFEPYYSTAAKWDARLLCLKRT